jgi:hypothetical protein
MKQMSPQPNQPEPQRIVLPSGKSIDVIRFEPRSEPAKPDLGPRSLTMCPSCRSHLVHPIDWDEAGPSQWEVTLRCPNCEWIATDVFEQDLVDQFDEELDAGTQELVSDLERLARANMEEAVERFVAALQDDHIVPSDF